MKHLLQTEVRRPGIQPPCTSRGRVTPVLLALALCPLLAGCLSFLKPATAASRHYLLAPMPLEQAASPIGPFRVLAQTRPIRRGANLLRIALPPNMAGFVRLRWP